MLSAEDCADDVRRQQCETEQPRRIGWDHILRLGDLTQAIRQCSKKSCLGERTWFVDIGDLRMDLELARDRIDLKE